MFGYFLAAIFVFSFEVTIYEVAVPDPVGHLKAGVESGLKLIFPVTGNLFMKSLQLEPAPSRGSPVNYGSQTVKIFRVIAVF